MITKSEYVKKVNTVFKKISHIAVHDRFTFHENSRYGSEIHIDSDSPIFIANNGQTDYSLSWNWLHTSAPKSGLLLALATPDNEAEIKSEFITLTQMLIDLDVTGNWQMQYLTINSKPFMTIAVFLTNSQMPQLISFADRDALKRFFVSKKENRFGSRFLQQLNGFFYLWQPVDPWPIYRKQIINLDPTTEIADLKDKILNFADNTTELLKWMQVHALIREYRQPLDILTHINMSQTYFNQIHFLSLKNLVKMATGVSQDIKKMQNDPEMKPILAYLANNLQ